VTFAGGRRPLDGGTLTEAGVVELVEVVELLELFRVVDRAELALVADAMFSD
jgi:hypothetical protein